MKKLFVLVSFIILSISLFSACYMVNGNMEDWTANGSGGPPDAWTLSSSSQFSASQESTTIHGGSYSTNLTWSTTSNRDMYQEFDVTAGNDYEFCSYIYDNDSDGRVRLFINWYDNSHSYISGASSDYSTDTAGWQYLRTGTQTAPANATTARTFIRCYDVSGWDGNATVYADDATFCDNQCLAVDLSSFYANFENEELTLHWKTYSETNNQGWNVYRSEENDLNTAHKVNLSLIPGHGTTTQMSEYVYKDVSNIENHKTYYYWIESVENSGNNDFFDSVSITINQDNEDNPTPEIQNATLSQNYPNPFNPDTNIEFDIPQGDFVSVIIYNIKGEKIKTLYSGVSNGHNIVNWNGTDDSGNKVSSGIYFYKLITENGKIMKKMLMLK